MILGFDGSVDVLHEMFASVMLLEHVFNLCLVFYRVVDSIFLVCIAHITNCIVPFLYI